MATDASSLGYALLGLLHQQEETGYGLQKFFEDSPMGAYSSSPGAIYPALKRLERNGLVVSRLREDGPVKRSKVYAPTAEGTEALRGWLTREITQRDVQAGMDELMLRFAFHGLLADRQATRTFLAELADRIEAYIDTLEDTRAQLERAGADVHSRLALEAGRETYRAQARWARRALSELESASNAR